MKQADLSKLERPYGLKLDEWLFAEDLAKEQSFLEKWKSRARAIELDKKLYTFRRKAVLKLKDLPTDGLAIKLSAQDSPSVQGSTGPHCGSEE